MKKPTTQQVEDVFTVVVFIVGLAFLAAFAMLAASALVEV